MSYDEDEEVEPGFKIGVDSEDELELGEPLDIPEGMTDFGLDDDPEDKYH